MSDSVSTADVSVQARDDALQARHPTWTEHTLAQALDAAAAEHAERPLILGVLEAARRASYDVSSLRTVMSAAAPAPVRLWQALRDELGVEEILTAYKTVDPLTGADLPAGEEGELAARGLIVTHDLRALPVAA